MLETIILLTGKLEQPALASALRVHNSKLSVRPVETAADVAALGPELLRRARLAAFASPVVVPAKVLNQLGYGAYNFHPGSPRFPGLAPSHFAHYQQATEFGATAHVMAERVDAGAIVGVELFRVPVNATARRLEELAYVHLARIFWLLAKALATQIEPLTELPIRWGGQKSSRRLFAAMCDIPLDISKEEFDRRINAFSDNHFGIVPTISLHGMQFQLMTTASCDLSRLGDTERPPVLANPSKREQAA